MALMMTSASMSSAKLPSSSIDVREGVGFMRFMKNVIIFPKPGSTFPSISGRPTAAAACMAADSGGGGAGGPFPGSSGGSGMGSGCGVGFCPPAPAAAFWAAFLAL